MSISGNTPCYVLLHRHEKGVSYALMRPRGWGDQLLKKGEAPSTDWMMNAIKPLVPPWQEEIDFREATAEQIAKLT